MNIKRMVKLWRVPPPETNQREHEHMEECQECRDTWPRFYSYHIDPNDVSPTGLSLQQISGKWCYMTEQQRQTCMKHIDQYDGEWISKYTKNRVSTGYQLFCKEQTNDGDFTTTSQSNSCKWRKLSEEQKQQYRERSKQLSRERKNRLRELSPFKKRQYKRAKKVHRSKRRPTKKCNPFVLYLKDVWTDEKRKTNPQTYRDTMKTAGETWKTMTECDKQPYMDKCELKVDNTPNME